jgi:hypothetical protein
MWYNSISLDHNPGGTADRGRSFGRDLIAWNFFALPCGADQRIRSVKECDLLGVHLPPSEPNVA